MILVFKFPPKVLYKIGQRVHITSINFKDYPLEGIILDIQDRIVLNEPSHYTVHHVNMNYSLMYPKVVYHSFLQKILEIVDVF